MRAKLLKVLNYLFIALLSLFLVYQVVKSLNPARLLAALQGEVLYLPLALAALCSLAASFVRALRWRVLVRPLGLPLSTLTLFHGLNLGEAAGFVLPRSGEVVRCTLLSRRKGLPPGGLLGTVVVERGADICLLALLLIPLTLFNLEFLTPILAERVSGAAEGIQNICRRPLLILLPALTLLISILFIYKGRKKLSRLKVVKRLGLSLGRLKRGITCSFRQGVGKSFLLLTILIWLLYALTIYLSFFSLPFTSRLGLPEALLLLLVSALGMAAPVQGGVGVYHFSVAFSLTLYGIEFEQGLLFALIVHGVESLLVLGLGLFSGLMLWKGRESSD